MIYLIITTSINNKEGVQNYEHRQNRYIDCIQNILNLIQINNDTNPEYNIKPIIVENNGLRETYLNTLNCDIVYTNNNILQLKHKGFNELLDIKDIINKYNINDDDIIIKLTGRYKILNSTFIDTIINNINKYDAYIKFFNVCTNKYMYYDCVLGLFAIKCKFLKRFEYNPNQFAEQDFAAFVRNNIEKDKIMEITNLHLECCFAGNLVLLLV